MNFKNERDISCLAINCLAVIGEARAICRADIKQACARLFHHFGNSKPTTNFDTLATAHCNIAIIRKSCQYQHDCGGIVIDNHRRFGSTSAGD